MPARALSEVAVTITVTDPPSVSMLHFWALQASFVHDGSVIGAAHFGLQHHPDYPQNGAVNWGGYLSSGGQLDGSTSALESALSNPNTRNYEWKPNRPYLYRIYQTPTESHRWRGSITDLVTGAETVVRDLHVQADSLQHPMVWSEVFAHCDHPSHTIQWSDLAAFTASGELIRPETVKLSYQTFDKGGCGNTNISHGSEPGSFTQTTNTIRTNPAGSRLPLANGTDTI